MWEMLYRQWGGEGCSVQYATKFGISTLALVIEACKFALFISCIRAQVWVNTEESERIAAYLNMSVQKFYVMYTKSYYKYDGWRLLKAKSEAKICFVRHEIL